jgi:hypothetical protein
MIKTVKFWIGFITIGTIGAGITYYLKNNSDNSTQSTENSEDTPEQPDQNLILNSEKRTVGKFNDYDYHFEPGNAVEINFKREYGGQSQNEPGSYKNFGETKISGTMLIHSVKYEDNVIQVIAKIKINELNSPLFNFATSYEFGIMKTGNEKSESAAEEKYKNTVLFRLSPTGRLLKLYKNKDHLISDEGAYIASDIFESAVVALPESFDFKLMGKTKALLTDPKGTRYEMNFNVNNKGADEIEIQGLTEINADNIKKQSNESGITPYTKKNLDILWNKKTGIPNSVQSEVTQKIKSGDILIAGANSLIHANFKNSGKSPYQIEDLKQYTVKFDLEAIRKTRERRNEKKDSMAPNFADAMNAVENISKYSEAERGKLFNDLTDLLKKNPDLVDNYGKMALNLDPGSFEQSMIVGAMGALGTPEAQKQMIDIFNSEKAEKSIKEKILTELAIPPQPLTSETKSFLRSIYKNSDEDLSKEAGYALGSSLSKAQDKIIITEFKEELKNAKTSSEKSYILEVMGNNRNSDFINEITTAAKSSDPEVRATAAESLRFTKEPSGRDALFSAVSDSNPTVRQNAYRSLAYQEYDNRTFNALSKCVYSEPEANVRATCYEVLLSRLNHEETINLLRNRANNEPSEQLKMKVTEALKTTENKN